MPTYTPVQNVGVCKIFFHVFKRTILCYLFEQKYCKNRNTVEYLYF